MRSIILAFAVIVMILPGCRKKPDPVIPPVLIDSGGVTVNDGHVKIEFENMVGTQPLQLGGPSYTNEAGNVFTVNMYKYYISNIKLWRADSTYYTETESYHLINEAELASKSFILHEVPLGEYTAITFMIGVDYDRNTSGAQTGALDPALAMFWDWNTGYIMAKMEGSVTGNPAGFGFHTGGFEGGYAVMRIVTLPLPEQAKVNGIKSPGVHIKSDVLEWFKTPRTIDLMTENVITNPGRDASMLADNYADMFTVSHVEN